LNAAAASASETPRARSLAPAANCAAVMAPALSVSIAAKAARSDLRRSGAGAS
jgi:hypothetical protein